MKKYTVLVDQAAGAAVKDVARHLRDHGFVVEQELDAIGVITGKVDEEKLPAIRAIAGIKAIERNREIDPIA